MVARKWETDVDRLTGNVLEELRAQNAMRGLGLEDDLLAGIAEQVAVNVDYAFECRWAPRWVREGQPHSWMEVVEGEERFHSECLTCGWLSQPARTAEAASHAFQAHRDAEH